jgi:hypothetical protein
MSLLLIILVAGVILFFGILLGCSWTDARYDQRSRRQAVMQRKINAEWSALQDAHHTLSPGSYPNDPTAIEGKVPRNYLDYEVV